MPILRNSIWIKELRLVFCALLAAARMTAVGIGDTRESVVAEKGPPVGEMGGGNMELLRYSDMTIKLRDGKVFGIEGAASHEVPSPSHATNEAGAGPVKVVTAPDGSAETHFARRFVGNPEFHTTAGVQGGGTACVATLPGDPQEYILTAHHLLGPDGGFDELITHEQVPSFVQGIELKELFGQPSWHPVSGCFVPGGQPIGGTLVSGPPLNDLAVFKVAGVATENTGTLAAAAPAAGEIVWVIAHVKAGVPEGELIHRARVVAMHNQWLVCEFENPNIVTNGASGAPVIDANGFVVGVYSGHATMDGHKYALIIPSTLIIETIRHF